MPRWAQYAMFLSITLVVFGGAHLYVYSRLASLLWLPPGRAVWALRAALTAGALSFFASRLLLEWSVGSLARWCYLGAAVWMGFFLYLLLGCVAGQLLTAIGRLAGLWPSAPDAARLPDRALALLTVVLAAALGAIAWLEAAAPPRITELEVPVKGGSPELDGFTIVQLSDIHLGAIVDGGQLARLTAMTNALNPDLVAITGDLVDENADRMVAHFEPLRDLRARYGVFAVTGNHEYYAGVEAVLRQATAVGVRFLHNEMLTLPNGLILCGMDDPTAARLGGERGVLEQVVGDAAREAPMVLLHHQPTAFEKAAALGVDLTLSGHTHHGQLWPLAHISRLFYPFQHGRYAIGASQLWVTAGAGTWGPPMRLGAPPEIVRVRLRTTSAT